MEKISLVVRSERYRLQFTAVVHQALSPREFHLSPEKFYLEYGKSIPVGVHHELEIVEPGEIAFSRNSLHISRSAEGKPFVCYPCHIPTTENAVEVFKLWCVGSMGTMAHKIDLNTLLVKSEWGNNYEKFLNFMKKNYDVYIV